MKHIFVRKNYCQKSLQKKLKHNATKLTSLFLLCILVISLSGCKAKTDVNSDAISSSESSETTDSVDTSQDNQSTQETDRADNSIQSDTEQAESIDSQAFTFVDLSHNIYTGTIGEERVIMDIYPNEEIGALDISFIGELHTKDFIYTCDYSDKYQVTYQDDSLTITLQETQDGVLTGSFIEGTDTSKDISLNLSHINATQDPSLRYLVGTNEEMEAFAAKVMEVIKNDDIESLSKMIQYPVYIHIEEGATAENADDLIAMSAQAVITPELKAALASTFPRFMFSNDMGVMLGAGEYNIWFNKLEDGIKITAINN